MTLPSWALDYPALEARFGWKVGESREQLPKVVVLLLGSLKNRPQKMGTLKKTDSIWYSSLSFWLWAHFHTNRS